jgi:hypothetical protein
MPLCDNCRKDSHQLSKSMTGRDLCPTCQDNLNATAATLLTTGSAAATTAQEMSTSRWLARFHLRRRER